VSAAITGNSVANIILSILVVIGQLATYSTKAIEKFKCAQKAPRQKLRVAHFSFGGRPRYAVRKPFNAETTFWRDVFNELLEYYQQKKKASDSPNILMRPPLIPPNSCCLAPVEDFDPATMVKKTWEWFLKEQTKMRVRIVMFRYANLTLFVVAFVKLIVSLAIQDYIGILNFLLYIFNNVFVAVQMSARLEQLFTYYVSDYYINFSFQERKFSIEAVLPIPHRQKMCRCAFTGFKMLYNPKYLEKLDVMQDEFEALMKLQFTSVNVDFEQKDSNDAGGQKFNRFLAGMDGGVYPTTQPTETGVAAVSASAPPQYGQAV